MTQIVMSDLFSHKLNPHPFYAQLREQGPLAHFKWENGEMWVATTYDTVVMILEDPRFALDERRAGVAADEREDGKESEPGYVPLALRRDILGMDNSEHMRLRSRVTNVLTPSRIEQYRPRIQQIVDALLDKVQDQGQMDIVSDLAFPLPPAVVSEVLGVPAANIPQFCSWVQSIVQNAPQAPNLSEAALADETAFIEYTKALLIEKRNNPGSDLISELVRTDESGDTLAADELVSLIILIMSASHGTTSSLITNGTLVLLEHPEQMSQLRSDPTLLPSAIEELLRYTTPVTLSAPRWTTEDISLHGQVIRKGTMVRGTLIAANTDPQQFHDPEFLDLLRRENEHLTFGNGPHYCLGAMLGRLMGQIAFGTLLRRMPHLRLGIDPEQLAWKEAGSLRSLKALPVTF